MKWKRTTPGQILRRDKVGTSCLDSANKSNHPLIVVTSQYRGYQNGWSGQIGETQVFTKKKKNEKIETLLFPAKNQVINHARATRASDAKKELHGAGSDLNKNTTTGGEIKRTGGLDRPSAELMTNSTACTYVVAADSTDLAASGVSTKTLESNPAEERRCQRRRFIYFPKCFLAGGHQQLASM